MNVTCPHCTTVFRVDPARIPLGGVRARCSRCAGIIQIESPARADLGDVEASPPHPLLAAPPPTAAAAPAFGVADPQSKARRLARALVSDIVVYHPDRRERGLRDGTLRQEFREEIRKSWEEYSTQVGDQMARGTPYFREALNEILAGGEPVF